ncbi:MAG: TIGR01459 family HAD-type hydrolase [Alphaproteobacteria bacterium]|nr:TIGR01459 family HAD-type hydrolase [Alphaproteobacteria bacterium]
MNNEFTFVAGLRTIAPMYDAFIVDLWGVIYEESRLCIGAFNALSQLSDIKKQVIFLSNTSQRSSMTAKKLEHMGVKRYQYNGILTSGEIIYHELRSRVDPFIAALGHRVFHLGPSKYWECFKDLDYVCVDNIDEANFILVTGTFGTQDELSKYETFFKACLSRRLPMVCGSPDSFILKDGVPYISAGGLAAHYQSMGGQVFWHGKPEANVFNYCVSGLDVQSKSRVAVIGDSLASDIAGAREAGLDTIFVAGGIHSKELGISRGQQPTADAVNDLFKKYGTSANIVMPAFLW